MELDQQEVSTAAVDHPTTRVVMIDDQPAYTEALGLAFSLTDDLEVVGQSNRGGAGVEMALDLQPDLVLCDYRLRGESSGTVYASQLRDRGFTGPIVILTGYAASQVVEEAALINGVLVMSKDLALDEIVHQLHDVVTTVDVTAVPVPSSSASPVIPNGFLPTRIEQLSPRLSPEQLVARRPAPEYRSVVTLIVLSAIVLMAAAVTMFRDIDPASRTQVSGSRLEQPYVMIDGTTAQARVQISIDGQVVQTFSAISLPTTVALTFAEQDLAAEVVVENLSASGYASCEIGGTTNAAVQSRTNNGAPAVCQAAIQAGG